MGADGSYQGGVIAPGEASGLRLAIERAPGLLADSEVIELVSVDARTGAERITTLQRLREYTVDYASGVVYFQKAVGLTDVEGNPQVVRVRYRLDDAMAQRQIAWGVQASSRLMDDRLTLGAAAVQLDGVTSVGVRARYADGISRADLLAAHSGGMLVNGTADDHAVAEARNAGDWLQGFPGDLDEADTHRNEMAFWMYSSGSTGRPKGIVHLQHDMAYSEQAFARSVLKLQPGDICLSVPKIFFAYGFGNSITFPFSVGAATLLLPGQPKPAASAAVAPAALAEPRLPQTALVPRSRPRRRAWLTSIAEPTGW